VPLKLKWRFTCSHGTHSNELKTISMSGEAPKIVVTPLGLKASAWVKRDEAVLAPYNRPFYYHMVVAGGEGAIVHDVDGNRYVGCLNSILPFSSTWPEQRRYFHPLVPGVVSTPYAYCYLHRSTSLLSLDCESRVPTPKRLCVCVRRNRSR
jgi:4-aminobutyrate aminotransferase-like enzyme